jgi:hypothetical protein
MRRLALAATLAAPLALAPPAAADMAQQHGEAALEQAANVTIQGAVSGDETGWSVAAIGDVNGDGIGDIAIGAPGAGNRGRPGAGSVYVVFGRSTPGTVDLASLGSGGYRIDGAVAGDATGTSIAAIGDVNGDGRPDLLIGAPGADPAGRLGAGSAYVVFGRASSTGIDLAALGTGGYRIDGAAPGDAAGTSVALAGDVNGDGRPDLAIGSPGGGLLVGPSAPGSVAVVFGQAVPARVDLAALGTGGARIVGIAPGDGTGTVLAGAGIGADGSARLAIGAPALTVAGRAGAGSAFVLNGSALTPGLTLSLGSLPAGSGLEIDGALPGDAAGASLADAGDVNGDGLDDLLVGAWGSDLGGRAGSGSAYVVECWSGGPTLDLQTFVLGGCGTRYDGAASNDMTGWSLARAGDVDGDGHPDLVIGALAAAPFNAADAGSAFVVHETGPGTVDLGQQGIGTIRLDGAAGDHAARAVAAGDVNGDGHSDVIVGAPDASPLGRVGAGAVLVEYGWGAPSFTYPASVTTSDHLPIGNVLATQIAHTGPYSFAISPTPPDTITFDPVTGRLQGAPLTSFATQTFTVTMTDMAGSVSRTLELTSLDDDPPGVTLAITRQHLARLLKAGRLLINATTDEPIVYTLRATVPRLGGHGAPVVLATGLGRISNADQRTLLRAFLTRAGRAALYRRLHRAIPLPPKVTIRIWATDLASNPATVVTGEQLLR